MKTIAQIIHQKNFPLEIYNSDCFILYSEEYSGLWAKWEYDSDSDSKGKEIYFENSMGWTEDNRE